METFTKWRPTPERPAPERPTPADVYRATQRQKLEEQDLFNAKKMPALQDGPSPAEISEPIFTHSVDLDTRAVSLDGQSAAPLEAQSLAAESSKNKDAIPDDTNDSAKAEAAPAMKRADFVKQQEDLFGANDEVKPEDVPEGELTYEQYLAQRPVAEEGDFYHHNNRVYSAVPTAPMKNKKAIYEAQLDTASSFEHYDELLAETNRNDAIDEATKENEHFDVVNEAIKENETKDVAYDRQIRINVEGEFLVKKEARLRGLLSVGEELLALYNSELTGEEYDKTIKPVLEEKQAMYDDLYKLYESQNVDDRALWYIADKTNARTDADYIPVDGSAYIGGEKVAVIDLVETTNGEIAYTIEKSDGTTESVRSDEVTFKRELEKYDAPKEEEPEPIVAPEEAQEPEVNETEPEKELSRFEKIKKLFSKEERKKRQEFGGVAYWSAQWSMRDSLLNKRKINESMSEADAHAQKMKNRQNLIFGLAALTVASAIARTIGLSDVMADTLGSISFDGLDADSLPHLPEAAENAESVPMLPGLDASPDTAPQPEVGNADGLNTDSWPRLPEAAEDAELVPMLPGLDDGSDAVTQPEVGNADGGAGAGGLDAAPQPEVGNADGGAGFVPEESAGGYETNNFNVDNPAYNIPSGGGGLELFHELGLSDDQWREHAPELLKLFPDTLYIENGDIRFMNEGVQPLNFRQAVEAISNR